MLIGAVQDLNFSFKKDEDLSDNIYQTISYWKSQFCDYLVSTEFQVSLQMTPGCWFMDKIEINN